VRARTGVLIVEHKLGLVMANAGIDRSNLGPETGEDSVLLLPEDPDGSADALRAAIRDQTGCDVAVIINDSFGRPWRSGTVGVAIGVAGIEALVDKRGQHDLFDRTLRVTVIGHADEIAAAASIVMGGADEGRPVVVVRGLPAAAAQGRATDLVRPAHEDMFR
jgi:coenzyme F420-0:L-glutamate ligase/coenzyme F420-1:gamma-L-glutamate ligase